MEIRKPGTLERISHGYKGYRKSGVGWWFSGNMIERDALRMAECL
jgi:hypothetical protein